MKNLVKKEFIVNRSVLLISLMLPLISFVLVFNDYKLKSYIEFSYFIALISILTVNSVIADKMSKGTDILFVSLPINREDIIKSKYIVYGLFPLTYSTILYFFYAIIKWPFSFNLESINFDIVIISSSISLITLAFIIPILLRWSQRFPIIGMLFTMLLILGNMPFTQWLKNVDLDFRINYQVTSIVIFVIAILSYLVSMKLSIHIFRKQYDKA